MGLVMSCSICYWFNDFGDVKVKTGEDFMMSRPVARYVCKMDWALLHERWQLGEQALQTLCFSAAYVVVLLHHGLGFDKKSQQIIFVPQGNISWAKGAIIWEANNRFSRQQPLCVPARPAVTDVCTGTPEWSPRMKRTYGFYSLLADLIPLEVASLGRSYLPPEIQHRTWTKFQKGPSELLVIPGWCLTFATFLLLTGQSCRPAEQTSTFSG